MIQKLRLKFVAVCMLLVTAVLCVVFASVYVSSQHNVELAGQAVLERVIRENSFLSPDTGSHSAGLSPGDDRIQLPYFTVQVWGTGAAYVTGGTYGDLENTDVLTDILSICMDKKTDAGTIEDYNLRYLRQYNGLYTSIAFVDMSMEQATLRAIVSSCLQIGCAALALLLGVSVLLSYWVTRPVEKAWKQQRQFLSDASHELKTPLTVILSNAEMMNTAGLPEKPARWADNILSEAGRMKSLVEQMLTLARADNAVRSAVWSEVDLSDVAADCALAFGPVAYEAGKRLDDDLCGGILVTGDAEKLRQVLSALLDNAVKYGRDGGVIRLTVRKTDRHAVAQVENENRGDPIPPRQLSRLFERFYRADDSRGEQTGFGLGLPIAAAIAAEHHGTLKAESDETSTRFILTLPLRRQAGDGRTELPAPGGSRPR